MLVYQRVLVPYENGQGSKDRPDFQTHPELPNSCDGFQGVPGRSYGIRQQYNRTSKHEPKGSHGFVQKWSM